MRSVADQGRQQVFHGGGPAPLPGPAAEAWEEPSFCWPGLVHQRMLEGRKEVSAKPLPLLDPFNAWMSSSGREKGALVWVYAAHEKLLF